MSELTVREILARGPVIPVVVIDDVERAEPLARSLLAGGVDVIEITLRTPAALKAVQAVARDVPEMIVGVGTVLTPEQLYEAREVGATFAVSPGLVPALVEAAATLKLPYLPGTGTASEMMLAMGLGLSELKFYPAEAMGGPAALRAYGSVYPELRFCPTGGIAYERVRMYLSLTNVAAVGGSWIAPRERIAAGDFDEITMRARKAQLLSA